MRKWFLGFTLIGILSGFVTSQSTKMTVLDYVNILSTKSRGVEVGFYVSDSGRPDVLDLKNDYVRYDGTFGRPKGVWDFTEVAVWRKKTGGDVVGVNYQEANERVEYCGDAPCRPSTQFFYVKNGEIVSLFMEDQPFYEFDTRVKNAVLLKAIGLVNQNDPNLDLTTILNDPWNLRYSFPRVGTSIEAHLSDDILRRSAKRTPIFYIKWRNGDFYASLTK
jgi:hypothetical protein